MKHLRDLVLQVNSMRNMNSGLYSSCRRTYVTCMQLYRIQVVLNLPIKTPVTCTRQAPSHGPNWATSAVKTAVVNTGTGIRPHAAFEAPPEAHQSRATAVLQVHPTARPRRARAARSLWPNPRSSPRLPGRAAELAAPALGRWLSASALFRVTSCQFSI